MSPVFQINFRRDAYQKDIARARRRVLLLGLWVAYFGAIVVVLGLYGLNCAVVTQRASQVERQAQRLRQAQSAIADTRLSAEDVALVGRYASNARRWRDRLARLASLLPPSVRLTSLAVGQKGLDTPGGADLLTINGVMHPGVGEDRMRAVMSLAGTLRADSVFSAGFGSIRLASTRIFSGSDPSTEFTIECR